VLLVVDSLESFIKESSNCKVRIAVEEDKSGETKAGKITLTVAKLAHVIRLDVFIYAKDEKELGIDMDAALKEVCSQLDKAKLKYTQGLWYP
jgi:hypothetical protein